VTIARSLTNSFAGIRPVDTPGFILAQIAGAFAATIIAQWLWSTHDREARGAARGADR
jgi:glycerol uptake facilitator-like aquaporin